MAFGSSRPIRSDEMAKVISWLLGEFRGGETFRKRLSEIASIEPESERERMYFGLYLDTEAALCQQAPKICPSPRALRFRLAEKFGLEKFTPSLFTAPFLSPERQVLFLLRHILERFVAALKISPETLERIASASAASPEFRTLFSEKQGTFAWQTLERNYLKLAREKFQNAVTADFRYIFARLFHEAQTRFGVDRARLLADEVFRSVAKTFPFLETLSFLLPVLPEGVLTEERALFYSKERLVDELQRRMRELEAINVSLQEEARKLRSAVVALEQAQQRMGFMQQAQQEFIRVVSHQFRTPLSVIRWESEVVAEVLSKLGSEAVPQKIIDQVASINRKAIFLADVLNRVFDLLALESKEFKLNRRPTSLWEILDEVRAAREKEAALQGISLEFSKENVPVDEVLVDPEVMKKVVDVFVANAIQYSAKGTTATLTLVKEKNQEGQEVFRIAVADQGVGISPEDQKNMFRKFFRGENAKRKSPDGAGIALHVAKRFVELHGGEVGVFSEGLGKGATFWCTIPAG